MKGKKIFKAITFLPRKVKNISKGWVFRKIEKMRNKKNKETFEKNKITYEINLIDKTFDFLKGVVHETYEITKKVKKSGMVQTIVVGFATFVLALSLMFGSGQPALAESPINPTPTLAPIERVLEKQIQYSNLTNVDKVVEGSKSLTLQNLVKISGGELGKPTPGNPGTRAKTDVLNAYNNRAKGPKGGQSTGVADAWVNHPTEYSRPEGANRLGEQLQPGQPKGGKGFFGRVFSPPTPKDLSNRGCGGGGPRSITVISGQKSEACAASSVVKTQTQISGFVKNGKVDLDKCLDEVNRRASEIGCTDFECSLERFKALATENGKLTSGTAREAITILQGEMQGYYRNARREDYGLNVKGPDFLVEGLGEFENITHVEVKNPVGSAIKIANGQKGSIYKQGKKIGAKIVYQQNYWSNTTKTSELENLNPTASLPQSPNNVLGAVDNFDVPSSEKALMEGSVLKGSQNNTNIIFLNNN